MNRINTLIIRFIYDEYNFYNFRAQWHTVG